MIDFYGTMEIVTLQLSKEDLLQSIFPVFMTNHCQIEIALILFLSRENFLKYSNYIARMVYYLLGMVSSQDKGERGKQPNKWLLLQRI